MNREPHKPADQVRTADLLWDGAARATRGPRPALSLERIVRQAIAIADDEGLAALSMQRLANRLGAGTMSLYRHVPGKDELVALMLDAAVGEPPRLPAGDWRAALEAWARANRDIFIRHPWALSIAARTRTMGPNEAAWAEAALQGIAPSGLPPTVGMAVMLAVNSYIRGAVQHEVDPDAGRRDGGAPPTPSFGPDVLARLGREGRFPILLSALTSDVPMGSTADEAGAQTRDAQPGDGQAGGAQESGEEWTPEERAAMFEFGLQRLLDGIEEFVRRS
jgi:AcrR family transcriptional regulator